MSEKNDSLVVLNNQNTLALGGVGLGSSLFRAKPSYIQLVPKSTRQEGAIPGTFRVSSSGERIGITDANGNVVKDEFKAVLLSAPQEQREYYINDGKTYSKEQKECFSLNNVEPHSKAKNPPAMFCSTCPMGDINWKKWREGGKTPDLLPKCQAYWHLFIAERSTQTPYNLDVKGRSVAGFKQAMETQMSGLLAKIIANTVQINKSRGYKLNKNTNAFEFVGLPDGVTEQVPAEPMPNIFDISFTIYSTRKDGDIVMGFKDFARMKEDDRKEFGALYAEFVQRKQERDEQFSAQGVSEEAQGNAEVTEPLDGEYVASKDAPISI